MRDKRTADSYTAAVRDVLGAECFEFPQRGNTVVLSTYLNNTYVFCLPAIFTSKFKIFRTSRLHSNRQPITFHYHITVSQQSSYSIFSNDPAANGGVVPSW